MKKVVLLGDSIRMGYDKYVKDALDGVCEVYYPGDNCAFANHLLRYTHEWKEKGKWGDDVDLVHWNAGLWDELELFEDEPISTKDYYVNAIGRIHKRLRMLFPKAKLVFATSTTVWEEKCSKDFRRHNATIAEYNEAALAALRDTDSLFNDLYTHSLNCPVEYRSDAVHFYTDGGTEYFGKKVLSVICNELGISGNDVNLDDFVPENYSKDIIGY